MSINSLPFHPFLFAFLPFLVLFVGNLTQLYPLDLVLPILLISIPIVLLLIGFSFFFKNLHKSGLFTSLIILSFFSYGFLFNKINAIIGNIFNFVIPHWIFLIPFLVIIILGFIYCLKTKLKLNNITTILNVMTITFIVVLSFQLLDYNFNPNYIFEDDIDVSTEFNLTNDLEEYPDIYYIILDAYAGEGILQNTFNYDNYEFIDFLNNNGFHTLQETQSNYPISFLSLSSSLNMQYVNFYADEVGIDSQDRRLPYNLFHNNRVMQILESNGYSTINFDSNWGPTNKLEIANQNLCEQEPFINSEIFVMVMSNTILKPVYLDIFLQNDRERIMCIFSELPEIQFKSKTPIFAFAHIMLPHEPYVWGPNGEHKKIDTLNMLTIEGDKSGYVDQLIFTNKMVQKMIEEILDSERQKIIIIQSDHGSSYPWDWKNPTDKMIYDRMFNINYILLPDNNEEILYDSITPVNVFRVLFNTYFNTNFEILEDRVFFSEYNQPYNFTDVTYLFPEI